MNNKPLSKKLLTLLVAVMLVLALVAFAACNPDDSGDGDDDTETVTTSPTVTNGNFANPSDSTEFPHTPTSWTGSGVTTSQSTATDSKPAMPAAADNTTSGAISLDKTTYNANNSTWGGLTYFAKPQTDLEEYTKDDNVLMIYNREAAYYSYKSSSITLSKDTDYVLTVSVRTSHIGGNEKTAEGFEKRPGAYIYLYGTSATYASFESITADEWTTYSFYIQGSQSSSRTVYLVLGLGKGDSSTTYDDAYLTSGYAFFDNVNIEAITDESTTDYESAVESATVKKTTCRVYNSEFDFASGNSPVLYTRKGSSSNSVYRVVNTEAAYFNANASTYGEVENPGVPEGSKGTNVYMIYNKDLSTVGYSTSNKLFFTRGKAYRVSIRVKTVDVSGQGATLIMTMGDDNTNNDLTIPQIDTQGEWTRYSFYIYSNQNVASQFYFQFYLGAGATAVSENYSKGYAFFDYLTVDQLDIPAGTDFEDYIETVNDDDAAFKALNLTTSAEDSLLANGYFTGGSLNGWTVQSDSEDQTKLNGVDYSQTILKVIGADEEYQIADGITLEKALSPYTSISDKVLMVYSPVNTLYGLDYTNSGTAVNIQPYTAYRFSIWVKTTNIPSGSGITVELKNGDTSLAKFSGINTESITSDLADGWKELVCYFLGGSEVKDITFSVNFGSGDKWSSSTLFKGAAYLSNISLVESTYMEYSSASSSGTYAKKYSFASASTTTSFTNGAFNEYNYSSTTGLTTGGMVDKTEGEGTELSKDFGVPSGWTVTSTSLTGSYYGIVDSTRDGSQIGGDNLIANLANVTGSNEDLFKNLFFNYSGDDKELYSYCGGNRALMIYSPDNTEINKEYVSYGYKTSSTTTLSANKYYEISVLVKTVGESYASIYLLSDNKVDQSTAFENISTSQSGDTDGWKKFTFRIKVGVSSVSVQLGLYLGKTNSPADVTPETDDLGNSLEYTANGGLVFFDSVTKREITEDAYTAANAADTANTDDIAESKNVVFSVDSFGLDPSSTHNDDGDFISPSNWTGSDDTAGSDSDTNAGILITDKYNYAGVENADELKANLTTHSGDNVLVIHNKAAGAYSFTSDSLTLSTSSYYRIRIWAKLYQTAEGTTAYILLNVPQKYSGTINVDSTEYKAYDFYVSTTSSSSLSSVTLKLGFGELVNEEPQYAAGYALFDDVEVSTITEDEYKAVTVDDYTKKWADAEDTSVSPEETETETDDDDNDFNWIIASSAVFGAVLVAVLIVYYARKLKRKLKPLTSAKPMDIKERTDKYNDLKD